MRKMQNIKQRYLLTIICLFLLALILGVLSISLGSYGITPTNVIKTFLGHGNKLERIAIFNIRLPRVLIAVLVGIALSTAGIILQGITRNDLAEPGILGINAGASLAVVIYIGMGSKNYYDDLGTLSTFTLPFIAMGGALLATIIIYALSWKNGLNHIRLILMGVGINSGLVALITVYQMSFRKQDFNRVLVWISGSLWGSSMKYFYAIAPLMILLLCLVLRKMRYLDLLILGEEVSTGLGMNVQKEQSKLLFYGVALAGCATAVSGSIGFLGLIAPHIARKLVGPIHSKLIPVSGLISVCIILFADNISRNLFAPIEIPVGITISLIGVPYFIYLMIRGDSNV